MTLYFIVVTSIFCTDLYAGLLKIINMSNISCTKV